MRRFVFITSVVFSLGLVGVAFAQATAKVHYRWVDTGGQTHFSDSLTDDAVRFGYDVINNDGQVVTHVSRVMTPAERAAAQKQAAAQAAQQSAIEARKREDLNLLNTYPDEDALKQQQQEVLESLDEQMSTTRVNLHTQDAALTDLLNRAADNERAKQAIPKSLADQIAAQRNVVANERELLHRQQANRETVVQQQAQDLQHYRDLRAKEKDERGY
ncbi:DUF4124 domain-containing protein [Dyella dinghuensis]|uniref:DUF4124 domain-containing protein n=1 Tax=Dyella dinghuensis TaxID=1920169 RepID=A0A432LPF2_9GAMM|nr:DUF4124 domain-containing protein [Dyella dinghuensis]RUL62069.1 DUF4124 domain-containing protein [Dyella dinghuensis]